MSDHSISIVPKACLKKEKEVILKETLEWLFAIDIVRPIKSDCILSKDFGYPISKGAKKIVIEPDFLPFRKVTNGLEIIAERSVFFSNELDKIICPNCANDISKEDWDMFNEWHAKENENLTCPKCKRGNEIHTYAYEHNWGFSDLGFVFWNWPMFTNKFISDFEKKIKYRVDIVHFHL